jgi:hypothetical protein
MDKQESKRHGLGHSPFGRSSRSAATSAPMRFANSAIRVAVQPELIPWRRAAEEASPAPMVSATLTENPGASKYSSFINNAQPFGPSVMHMA